MQNGSEGENEAINSIVPKEEIYNTVEFAVDDEPELPSDTTDNKTDKPKIGRGSCRERV